MKHICPTAWEQYIRLTLITFYLSTDIRYVQSVLLELSFVDGNYKMIKFKWSKVNLSINCVYKNRRENHLYPYELSPLKSNGYLFWFFSYSYFQFVFLVVEKIQAYSSLIAKLIILNKHLLSTLYVNERK